MGSNGNRQRNRRDKSTRRRDLEAEINNVGEAMEATEGDSRKI